MEVHIIISLIVVLLNLIPNKNKNRKNVILPFSFIIIAVYLSIRYNYGPDYYSYKESFYSGTLLKEKGTGEMFFYQLMHLFNRYYMFIIFHTLVILFTLFHLVRRYMNQKYYSLFFFIFLTMSGMMFTMISALRSTTAACVIFWGIHLFYLKRKNVLGYLFFVIIASLFHTSALVFLIIPIFDKIYKAFNHRIIFTLLLISLLLGMFINTFLFTAIFEHIDIFKSYSLYLTKHTTSSASLLATIYKSSFLLQAYFILKYLKKQNDKWYYVGMIAILYLFIYFLHLDFEARFTTYMFVFLIFSSSRVLSLGINKNHKFLIIIQLISVSSISIYNLYKAMYLFQFEGYSVGNFLWYQTIFSLPSLP